MVVAQQEIEQARALARQGNSQAAIALLSKLIQRDAGNVEAWLALAVVVEEPDRVEFCLQKVLNLDPGNAAAIETLSRLERGRGSFSLSGDKPREKSIDAAQQRDPAAERGHRGAPEEIESDSQPAASKQDHANRVRSHETSAPPARRAAAEPRRQTVAAASPSATPSVQGLLAQGGKLLSSFSRTDLILIGLTVFAGLMLCGLVGAAVIGKSPFSSQPADSPDEVVQVVFDNVIAANREDLGAYMATIHPDSPRYNATQTSIRSAFSLYDLSYEIFIPEMIEQDKFEAIISFVLTTRKVQGPAFQNNTVTGEMTLRKYEGEWKIYDQRVDNIQYLN